MYQPIKRITSVKLKDIGDYTVEYRRYTALDHAWTLYITIDGTNYLYCFNAENSVDAYDKIQFFGWVVTRNLDPECHYVFKARFSRAGLYVKATDIERKI